MILAIVLALHCSSSWCQSESIAAHPSTGGIAADSVYISIELIRKANVKLIQAEADIQLKLQLKNMIEIYKSENEILNATIDRQKVMIDHANKYNSELQDNNYKLKKQRNILAGTSIGFGLIIILILL